MAAACAQWVRDTQALLRAARVRRRLPELHRSRARRAGSSAYFGANLARLQAVKRRYDPGGRFAFAQGVTLASVNASMRAIDVCHQGLEHVICCWQVDDVHRRPRARSRASDTLLDALGDEQPRALLLTHIHFDHAGAAGALVRELARPRGLGPRARRAPPRRPDAARRLGQAPVRRGVRPPLGRGRADPGAARCACCAAARAQDGWDVAYTPGHASHHVSYRHARQRLGVPRRHRAACGCRRATCCCAPTPPPDFDLEAWRDVDRHDRGVGAADARDHALRRLPRRRRAPRPPARGARATGASSPRAPTATATPPRCAPSSPPALDEQRRRVLRPGDAAGGPVARASTATAIAPREAGATG